MTKGEKKGMELINLLKAQWGATCLKIANIDLRVIGEVRKKVNEEDKLVYVCNHQGGYDIPILFYCLPSNLTFIAKKELFSIPILGFWMRKAGCIPMDRENPRKGLESIKNAVVSIHKGMSPVIFPEGTRSRDPEGKLLPFKKGSLKVAIKSGAKIIPIAIDGTRTVFQKDAPPGKIRVCIAIGDEINFDDFSKEDQKNFSNIMQDNIETMFQKCKENIKE